MAPIEVQSMKNLKRTKPQGIIIYPSEWHLKKNSIRNCYAEENETASDIEFTHCADGKLMFAVSHE